MIIKMGGNLIGKYILNDYAGTVEEAIKKDYTLWKDGKQFVAELNYKGKLLKRLDNDCSFGEEIAYLEMQISKIDKEVR